MKLEDIKIGQFLKDKFGNRYKVVEVNEDDDFAPVELKCVKFANSVYFW